MNICRIGNTKGKRKGEIGKELCVRAKKWESLAKTIVLLLLFFTNAKIDMKEQKDHFGFLRFLFLLVL
jgi:hypothetical protein